MKPIAFSLRQLQYVVAVADAGRFNAAADHCGVSQPALSAQIAELESALAVRIFEPPGDAPGTRAAILLLHGGDWSAGEANWMDADAAPYASLGMLALSLDYRLSDGATVTPFDALADVRTAIRWMRAEAKRLRIDPARIAVLGESAGAHLAASAKAGSAAVENVPARSSDAQAMVARIISGG